MHKYVFIFPGDLNEYDLKQLALYNGNIGNDPAEISRN